MDQPTTAPSAAERPLLYAFPDNVARGSDGAAQLTWSAAADPFRARHAFTENAALQTIVGQRGALTEAECRSVIEIGEATPRTDGRVELGDSAYRVSHIAWILPDDRNRWLFHKIGALFRQAAAHYGFELVGLLDPLQYTSYGPDEHFGWHMDLGQGATSLRKLSLTIQLSAGEEYTGGELEFINAAEVKVLRERGAATFFPSYLAHRVTDVEFGERRSLVAWACGPAFR